MNIFFLLFCVQLVRGLHYGFARQRLALETVNISAGSVSVSAHHLFSLSLGASHSQRFDNSAFWF